MSETSKKIIEEIHKEHVTCRPKWHFFIRNAFVWAALGASLLFGALSASIEESVLERGLGPAGCHWPCVQLFRLFIQGASLLWIGCALLFLVLAFLNLRHLEEGYRYRAIWALTGIILTIAVVTVLLCNEGIGNRTESAFERHEPAFLEPQTPPPGGWGGGVSPY